jgi:hypothetical protein
MAVPPIVHAEHTLARALQRAGATSADTAQPLHELRPIEERALGRLVAAGAIRDAGPGRFWLDESAYGAVRGGRRRRALLLIALVILILAALVALGIVRF